MWISSDWENQLDADYEPRWPGHWTSDSKRPNFEDLSYGKALEKARLTRFNVPIKAVGVWDTVGALGIPDIGPFNFRKSLSFVDTEVSTNVSYAFQALALDERRRPYLPTVWQTPKEPSQLKVLKQCWFPGVHANIGSGYADTEIADLTLAWMISQLQSHNMLEFLPDYCLEQNELNIRFYRNAKPPQAVRTWGLGTIYNSMTMFFVPAGEQVRSPGRNCETDPKTGEFSTKRLKETHEFIHPSVRIRLALHGDGPAGDGVVWAPEALKGWKLLPPNSETGGEGNVVIAGVQTEKRFRWVSQDGNDDVEIFEDKLESIELELLKCSPAVYERFADTL